jgi:hypothetical protein
MVKLFALLTIAARQSVGERTMRNTFAIALLLAAAAHAQETTVYRLNFAVHQTESGKTESTRNFTMTVAPREQQRLNIGTRLPVPTSPGASQFTYVDVGVSVRAKILESGTQLLLNADVDISGLGAERETGPAPRIEQIKATIDTAIPLDKATRVVAMDDPVGPKHYEIEVTASKVK